MPSLDSMEGEYYGLFVSQLADMESLIALGPDVTPRRALAAFAAYWRWTDPVWGPEMLREKLRCCWGQRVVVCPTQVVWASDGGDDDVWNPTPHVPGAPLAAWLVRNWLPGCPRWPSEQPAKETV